MKGYAIFCIVLICSGCLASKTKTNIDTQSDPYLSRIKVELEKKWPDNKTINIVFHGHSVPAGYFVTPLVNTLASYPYLVLKKLKVKYPHAVVNTIVTGIGGENSIQGLARFKTQVLNHKPDVLFIDYGLNDRRIGLSKAMEAWEEMILEAKKEKILVILLTPSPDSKVDYSNPENELRKHAEQIRLLAQKYEIGLVDNYKAFEFLYENKKKLSKYLAQANHPNKKGHELIANEIMKYF